MPNRVYWGHYKNWTVLWLGIFLNQDGYEESLGLFGVALMFLHLFVLIEFYRKHDSSNIRTTAILSHIKEVQALKCLLQFVYVLAATRNTDVVCDCWRVMVFGSFILAVLFWNVLKENLCWFWGFCLLFVFCGFFYILGGLGLLFPSHFIKELKHFCAVEGDFSSCSWKGQLLK